jgi:hypothetical protein
MKIRPRILLGAGVAALVLGLGAWRALRAADSCGPECHRRASAGDARVACDLGAFTPEERRAHEAEGAALLAQVRAVREIDDGFELRLPAAAASSAGHWFVDERRCCPFLSLEVGLAAGADDLTMTLRGPTGTKDILRPALASR